MLRQSSLADGRCRWREAPLPGCFAEFESEMKSDFSAEMFRATETFFFLFVAR